MLTDNETVTISKIVRKEAVMLSPFCNLMGCPTQKAG